jgi:torulene dioxygenase
MQIKHWFDGLSQLHRFDFKDGKVTYKSRIMATAERDVISQKARFNYPTFGQPMDMTKLGRVVSFCRALKAPVIPSNNQASLAAIKMASEAGDPVNMFVIKTDHSQLLQFDPDSLEPVKVFNYGDIGPGVGVIYTTSA